MLGSIHIVHYDALEDYIDIIRNYYWSKSDYIVNHQTELLNLVKESLIRWEDFNPFNR
jgi:hypothetical protein